jgi:hypothetical protein
VHTFLSFAFVFFLHKVDASSMLHVLRGLRGKIRNKNENASSKRYRQLPSVSQLTAAVDLSQYAERGTLRRVPRSQSSQDSERQL